MGYLKSAKDGELEYERVWTQRRLRKTPVVTSNAEVNTSVVELHSQATEVASADKISQLINAAISEGTLMQKLAHQNIASATIDLNPNSIKVVPVSVIQGYKPESSDQVHVPQSRKRRGKPTKAGPSKRSRTRAKFKEDFYVGKLSNVCTEAIELTSDLDSGKPYIPKPNYGYIWKQICDKKKRNRNAVHSI